jgi:hypothetical protein
VPQNLLAFLSNRYGIEVTAENLIAYIAAVAAHSGFTARFHGDLTTPGLRIPLTGDGKTFVNAAEIGRTVIWLHTFGERMTNPEEGRPAQPPRLPKARMPRIPTAGAIPQDAAAMPDSMEYDPSHKRILIGRGYIENVEAGMWDYEVSGMQVVPQWFSYRKANRERPIIGDRRPPSPLSEVQPDHWLAEYTTELINVLNVLGLLVDLEPTQAKLLERICSGAMISGDELRNAGVLEVPAKPKKGKNVPVGSDLFDDADPVTEPRT